MSRPALTAFTQLSGVVSRPATVFTDRNDSSYRLFLASSHHAQGLRLLQMWMFKGDREVAVRYIVDRRDRFSGGNRNDYTETQYACVPDWHRDNLGRSRSYVTCSARLSGTLLPVS